MGHEGMIGQSRDANVSVTIIPLAKANYMTMNPRLDLGPTPFWIASINTGHVSDI